MIRSIWPLSPRFWCLATTIPCLLAAGFLSKRGAPANAYESIINAPNARVSALFEEYLQTIPKRMAAEGVPGLAIAVVDGERLLWASGFGRTDRNGKIPVTPDTLFSIQSMSKSFTAVAVLRAVQGGLVDIDAPISSYIPGFHVNSIFEEHPEDHMTLRILLCHTAGLAHEAPVGNNYDLPGATFEQHIESITNTWLKFPIGSRYSYSNLGIDLAGYILQVRSTKPFTDYVRENVLASLGMTNSTLDVAAVRQNSGRAIGCTGSPARPPVGWLIIPSGGVWTTANDMARYLRFHINRGALDGVVLREDLMETMLTPPNEAARRAKYALGIAVTTRHGARRLQHGGGGFGFNSNMIWYPELKLGVVVLSNRHHERLYAELGDEILDRIIDADPKTYAERARKVPPAPGAASSSDAGGQVLSNSDLASLIASHALPASEDAFQRWKTYCGTYRSTLWGMPDATVGIEQVNDQLRQDNTPLVEVQPGLFFGPEGDAWDFRGSNLSIRSVQFNKIRPATRR